MCLRKFFTGKYGPSARVADGRLVLSLPDAETPVVWVMDLDEASVSVIRLEFDKQGHSILKRYGAKSAAETIAVYRDRNAAERALIKASSALENAKNSRLHVGPNSQPVIIRPASMIGRVFTGFLYLWFTFYMGIGVLNYISVYFSAAEKEKTAMPHQQMEQPQPQSGNSGSEIKSGVPLSADDYLKKGVAPAQ